MENPLAADLDLILEHTLGCWEGLRGERLFITGGTGFFGCWVLESFLWANGRVGLGAEAVVLTRNPEAFAQKAPHVAHHPAISLHQGDVRDFAFPEGEFARIVHAANDPDPTLTRDQPLLILDTIVAGTRHTLDFARHCGAADVLFTSSGTVYGKQPPELPHIPEDHPGAPDPASPNSIYGEGKRLAELLCVLYNAQYGLRVRIARCFAFVGPYLPLDANFAAGNFIRDALAGGPIRISGDGTPFRSYLYAADLTVWLWTILSRGQPGRPYNVGSEEALSISELAHLVAGLVEPHPDVSIAQTPVPGVPATRYVPSVARGRSELGLSVMTDLQTAFRRTILWLSHGHQSRGPAA
jgi:nucleoside-diphosphate-sugar epimerase